MAKTQGKCENIARGLGLETTTATWSGWDHACGKPQFEQYLRCVYSPDQLGVHDDDLNWNVNCGDNANIELNDSYYYNLCIGGNQYDTKSYCISDANSSQ